MMDDMGQSEVMGTMLILVLTIISVGVITVYSVPNLLELQDMAHAERVQQGFTVLDSQTSKAALGESPRQVTNVELGGGTVYVNDNYTQSRMRIRSSGGIDFTCNMGLIKYVDNGYEVAYEGGGVWAKYPTGEAVMVSPPEFHYNGVTLTLPLMHVVGNGSVAGEGSAVIRVSSENQPEVLYPSPVNGRNPVNSTVDDQIHVYITSEYYRAWADYANSQTYTTAETFPSNNTVDITLEVLPPQGTGPIGSSFKIGRLNETKSEPVYNFSFHLEADGPHGLHPYRWYVEASSGTKTLEYTLYEHSGEITVEVEYEDTAPGGGEEEWESTNGFTVYGKKEDQYANVDLLSDTITMDYDTNDPDFSWVDPPTNVGTTPGLYIDNSNNETQSLNNLTQHYLKLLTRDGPVEFEITSPGHSDPVDYQDSSMTLRYDGMPGAITYLHVTDNRLNVSVR